MSNTKEKKSKFITNFINKENFVKLFTINDYYKYQAYIICYYAKSAMYWYQTIKARPGDKFFQKNIDCCIEKLKYKQNKVSRNLNSCVDALTRLTPEVKRDNVSIKLNLLNEYVEKSNYWDVVLEIATICDIIGFDFDTTNFLEKARKLGNKQ
jgi:hypothetical protein